MASLVPIRSFAVTFRPLGGVTDAQIQKMLVWVKRKCTYYHMITEKLDHERHIHAALFLKVPSRRSSLLTTLCRLYPDLTFDEKKVFQTGIKSMYNPDWIKSYLAKGDDTVVVERNLPEAHHLEVYFDEVPVPDKKGPRAVDPFYNNLEKLWLLHKRPDADSCPENIRHFLMDMMNNRRLIRVISDNRKVFQISCALSRYINKTAEWSVEPDAFHQDV